MPGDAVKGKTWGPSSASAHVKQRPTIVPERGGQGRWKATSAPSLEKSPRNHVSVPSVGTVPEGEKTLIKNTVCAGRSFSRQTHEKNDNCFSTQAAYEEVIYFHPSLSEYCIQYQPQAARLLSPRLSMRLSCKLYKTDMQCTRIKPLQVKFKVDHLSKLFITLFKSIFR